MTGHKLFAALHQFHKADWKQRLDGNKPSEMTLMISLAHHVDHSENVQGLKVSELSRFLGLTPPTVTQLINSLEAKGMVRREPDPSDRRVVRVALTERGIRVTDKARKHRDYVLGKLVEFLGEEDSDRLADLLIKVKEFISQNPPPRLEDLPMNGDDEDD
ncbi:hypothetical protein PSTEL_25565 [Paenibacillus stellifer]|uniref:HTH marR-type domain-containing protein n=1 Tax=Paenibacillus stellifer TaxID=169760 RepID=A0A089LWU3_9BACL|nr:MarR family transcriptional regulator [Paenibacillus stellifer]AIQ65981.1 hypothetical protein PSTEL_25565 [Paenibacillus stellifer]